MKSFKEIDSPKDKTDPNDAISIAQRLRFRQPEHPFNASMDYIPLQRLTRFRTHLASSIAKEKNYFLSHLYLKYSAYTQRNPFSDTFGATSVAVISEFFSVEELADVSVEHLLQFVIKHGKNRFAHPIAGLWVLISPRGGGKETSTSSKRILSDSTRAFGKSESGLGDNTL